jgi:hypothetical protein
LGKKGSTPTNGISVHQSFEGLRALRGRNISKQLGAEASFIAGSQILNNEATVGFRKWLQTCLRLYACSMYFSSSLQ